MVEVVEIPNEGGGYSMVEIPEKGGGYHIG